MKKVISTLTLSAFLTGALLAQDSNNADTTKKADVNFSFSIPFSKKDKDEKSLWGGLAIGTNTFVANNKPFQSLTGTDSLLDGNTPLKSMYFAFTLFGKDFNLIKNKVNFTTGASLAYKNFGLRNNAVYLKDEKEFSDLAAFNHTKQKLRIVYLQVPTMLSFVSKPTDLENSLRLSAGLVTGLRLWSSYKVKYVDLDGKKQKAKMKNDFNFAPVEVNAALRVGYGYIDLFAQYSLTNAFKSGQGSDLNVLTVGIAIRSL